MDSMLSSSSSYIGPVLSETCLTKYVQDMKTMRVNLLNMKLFKVKKLYS